jgi:hypothetical protein
VNQNIYVIEYYSLSPFIEKGRYRLIGDESRDAVYVLFGYDERIVIGAQKMGDSCFARSWHPKNNNAVIESKSFSHFVDLGTIPNDIIEGLGRVSTQDVHD